MKFLDALNALDGAGLVITDEKELDEQLDNLRILNDAMVVPATLITACNFIICEIEKWNAGKTHNIGAAFEELVSILDT